MARNVPQVAIALPAGYLRRKGRMAERPKGRIGVAERGHPLLPIQAYPTVAVW